MRAPCVIRSFSRVSRKSNTWLGYPATIECRAATVAFACTEFVGVRFARRCS